MVLVPASGRLQDRVEGPPRGEGLIGAVANASAAAVSAAAAAKAPRVPSPLALGGVTACSLLRDLPTGRNASRSAGASGHGCGAVPLSATNRARAEPVTAGLFPAAILAAAAPAVQHVLSKVFMVVIGHHVMSM